MVHKYVMVYSLLVSTPRHMDHSLRLIRRFWSKSQYLTKLLAQALGFINFLTILFSSWTSLNPSTLSWFLSNCVNFHSTTCFSGVMNSGSSFSSVDLTETFQNSPCFLNQRIHVTFAERIMCLMGIYWISWNQNKIWIRMSSTIRKRDCTIEHSLANTC